MFNVLHGLTIGYCLWKLNEGLYLSLLGLIVMAISPLLQLLTGYDIFEVPHYKVRLPKTSLLVFLGLATVIVSIDGRTPVLWLAFLNLGAFLLTTYWAKE